jgi:hypothetical protein
MMADAAPIAAKNEEYAGGVFDSLIVGPVRLSKREN